MTSIRVVYWFYLSFNIKAKVIHSRSTKGQELQGHVLMCMKLPVMFHQNPTHTFDKIVEEHITTKMLSKLDLEPKDQGHSRC